MPMKMEQTECSETSAYKIQTPGNYPEESIHQHFSSLAETIVCVLMFIQGAQPNRQFLSMQLSMKFVFNGCHF